MSYFLGEFALDDELNFVVYHKDATDMTAPWDTTNRVAFTHYDIWDIDADDVVGSYENESLAEVGSAVGGTYAGLDMYYPNTPIVLSTANGFVEGKTYAVIAKSNNDKVSTTETLPFPFRLGYTKDITKIAQTDVSDSTFESSLTNTIMGRLLTLEYNQKKVIMPRTKRLLGLLGEHQMVDGYLYDDAGNITECRIRVFTSQDDALNATPWEDRVNESDPTSGALESGELYRYSVTASHLLPRNLRTLYEGAINTDASDNSYINSSVT